MFTVCPKCALTLVVTAADLRVAQGYVRCGRCSNVFNALARLSDDRQPPAPEPAPKQPRNDTSASWKSRAPAEPQDTSKTRSSPEPSDTTRTRAPSLLTETATHRVLQERSNKTPRESAESQRDAPAAPRRYDDNSLPDDALEFNPEATDVTKVFVEQAPSPKFTAATGTFQALRQAEERAAEQRELETRDPAVNQHDDAQVDVELDADLLGEITSNKLTRLNLTPGPGDSASSPEAAQSAAAETPGPASAGSPARAGTEASSVSSSASSPAAATGLAVTGTHRTLQTRPGATRAPAAATTQAGAKPIQRPTEETREPPSATRTETARSSASETAEAIRNALLPRKRTVGTKATATGLPTPAFSVPGQWTTGTAALLVMLLLQVVHHYRNDLAATSALHGPLTAFYGVFGVTLVPRWNLSSYEVRQLGASTDPAAPGQITVRASVKNGAHQSQPLPLLRVTLQDRFGNRIASRDVAPQSYLPHAAPHSAALSPGQRIDAEMAFVDPGSNAVGFEIDACLPAAGGGISCANDAASP